MLFTFCKRKTRSGVAFSPFEMEPISCENLFDLPECIKLAVERDCDDAFEPFIPGSTPPGPPLATAPAATTSSSSDTPTFPPATLQGHAPIASASNFPATDTPPETHKQSSNHKKRRIDREKKIAKEGHAVRPEVIATHVVGSTPVTTGLDTKNLPATSCGYAAAPQGLALEGELFTTVEAALEAGYTKIPWNGLAAMPLTDKYKRVFAVLVGRPNDHTYDEACQRAYEAIMQEGAQANFSKSETSHRRGDFPAVNVGVTMGLGATSPTNLDNSRHGGMMEISSFIAAFSLWAPNVYAHYIDRIGELFEALPHLRRIFPKSIFPAAAFNFGPNVWTLSHRDLLNFAIGWCAIQALGLFDPKKGGHFVLPDLKLVIEFPPNSLILVPSATLTHANIPVRKGESRVSFTQYCSGGLFRFVTNRFCTERQLRKEDPERYEQIMQLKSTRWEWGLSLYSKLDDIVSHISSQDS